MISTPSTRAAFRILTSTPAAAIRTHLGVIRDQPVERLGAPPPEISAYRRQKIAQLYGTINPDTGKKWKQRELGALLKISQVAVRKHLRALRGGRYHRGGDR